MKNKLRLTISLAKMFLLLLFLAGIFFLAESNIFASTPSPSKTSTVTPAALTPILTITPSSTASSTSAPEEEKIQEIRQAIKDKVNQIKENIEKRAFVGQITEITDSVIILNNFRGKQRIRITDETKIIENKKEIKSKDLAVEDKVIAMGTMSENDILEAKRIVVIPAPKTPVVPRLVLFGKISSVDSKNSTLSVTPLPISETIQPFKTDKTSKIFSVDQKTELKIKDLKETQKVIIVFPQTAANKTPIPKSIFLLN